MPLLGFAGLALGLAGLLAEVPIRVQVAQEAGAPVVSAAWVDAQIDEANRLFAQVPLRFRRIALTPGRGYPAHLVTRRDRDVATRNLAAGVINLRIAASLMDIDQPGVVRRGVHWHLRADPQRRCVLLSAIAGPNILAHELGHYFGNSHSAVPDNLMSYERAGGAVTLSAEQRETVRHSLSVLLRTGALRRLSARAASR